MVEREEPQPDPRILDATAILREACEDDARYAAALAVASTVTLYTFLVDSGIATPDEVIRVFSRACRGLGTEVRQMDALRGILETGRTSPAATESAERENPNG